MSDDIGESALPTALPWDTIEPQIYRPYTDLRLLLPTLNSRHEERMATDPDFVFIRAEIDKVKEDQANNLLTLNETRLMEERKQRDEWRLALENQRRAAKGLELLADTKALDAEADENADGADLGSGAAANGIADGAAADPAAGDDDKDDKESDPYLVESGRILLDMLSLQGNRVAAVRQAAAQ